MKSLSHSTILAYNRAWAKYSAFSIKIDIPPTLPIAPHNLELFITDLFNDGRPASSIVSTVSGLGFFHKINNLFDPAKSQGVQILLHSIKKSRPSTDSRRPVTEDILFRMLSHMPSFSLPRRELHLFQTMFLMAFYFGLRIGEITESRHNLLRSNVTLLGSRLFIHFSSFKHSLDLNSPHFLQAAPCKLFCPVAYIKRYLSVRGDVEGPLFLSEGKPISRNTFLKIMRLTLQASGLPISDFNTHSFRIGAATYWAQKGLSDLMIKKLGRWRSDAVFKYIRGGVDHSV